VTTLIKEFGCNIVSLDQYSDNPIGGNFFQRLVFTLDNISTQLPVIDAKLAYELNAMGMNWTLTDQSQPKRMAILASTSDHCLLDLLWRHRRGELPVTIPMVISNHTIAADDVRGFNVPFFHVPSGKEDKSASEAEILKLLKGNVDFVVLARYMQILTDDFLTELGVPVINIHHSFLPAFIGANPYRKAKERGVKLIGATSHYVTGDLDEGPIIEQDVVRVTHTATVEELQRRGAEVERSVLSRAVRWHAQDRVIRHGNHTIVFAS
jgi:formyltetrahydrofolate deformylase